MNYKTYKNRSIDFTKQVKIYKNLHNGLFSVMQNGLVVAHVESFVMNNVSFKVNESGRQRVLKEKKKNVHAFIVGTLQNVNNVLIESLNNISAISYNPYKSSNFYFKDDMTMRPINLHNFEIVGGSCKTNKLFLIN